MRRSTSASPTPVTTMAPVQTSSTTTSVPVCQVSLVETAPLTSMSVPTAPAAKEAYASTKLMDIPAYATQDSPVYTALYVSTTAPPSHVRMEPHAPVLSASTYVAVRPVSLEPTVRQTLMTVQMASVKMEERVWTW